ncbi:MAG: thioredoxin family protein [Chitinophagaceae bacterium]|nr:thioredoxin family protein [Anaerolineae bacterium]
MIERILFAVILLSVGFSAYQWFTRQQIKQATVNSVTDPLLTGMKPGVPIILYFTTPTCVPCRLQQTPTLQRLQQELGDALKVIRVDATENPEAADRWRVFSVPTTFVLDGAGHARKVYNGLVDAETLKRELQAS